MKDYAKYLQQNMNRNASELQTITTKFDTPSVSMAEAISERFGEARITVLRNVIEQGVKDLFLSFDEKTRKELASVADKKTTAYMLSKGASCKNVGVLGSSENEWIDWQMEEYSFLLNGRIAELLKNDPSMGENDAIQQAHSDIKSKYEGEK